MSRPNPYTDNSIRSEIRRLVRLHAREQLDEVLLEYIKDNFIPALSPIKAENARAKTEEVIAAVTSYFEITVADMCVDSRKKSICFPRQVMQFMLATRTNLTLEDIGAKFGQHYTTVIASRNKLMIQYKNNASVRKAINAINKRLPKRDGEELYDPSTIEPEDAIESFRPDAEYSNHSPWQIAS